MGDSELRRIGDGLLEDALGSFPIVVLSGARQTGKSTLASRGQAAAHRAYVSLDDIDVLDRARNAPEALATSHSKITIDEVQRAPELLLAIKRVVDRDPARTPGRFLLTGSANLLLMKGVSETLAGRAVHLTLNPMTRRELLGTPSSGPWDDLFKTARKDWPDLLRAQKMTPANWVTTVQKGGYPVPAHRLRKPQERALWHASYVQTYLERDLRDLSTISDLVDFRRLMRAACLRLGNLVNQTELGRDVGMPQSTVFRHLDLIEISHLLVRLPPYSRNRTSRLIKTPKLFWNDTALALQLSGEAEPRGAHLENHVLSELLTWKGTRIDGPQVMYWRTASGHEVDFLIEWKGRLLPIEVKATPRPGTKDAKSLLAFREEYGKETLPGLLLHTGDDIYWLADSVLAAPWWVVA